MVACDISRRGHHVSSSEKWQHLHVSMTRVTLTDRQQCLLKLMWESITVSPADKTMAASSPLQIISPPARTMQLNADGDVLFNIIIMRCGYDCDATA